MGYTHYMYHKADAPLNDIEWERLVAETKSIIRKADKDGIKLAGWNGHGDPVVDDMEIRLNGAAGTGCGETFTLTREPDSRYARDGESEVFNFCKTGHAPYDAVVVSILAAARKIAPDKIRVASDGGEGTIKRVY